MLSRSSSCPFLFSGLIVACLCVLLLTPAVSPAQARRATNVILPTEGATHLKRINTRDVYNRFKVLRDGQETASKDKKEDMDAIDITAQWLAYRLTWAEFQTAPNGISKLYDEFEFDLGNLVRAKPRNQACFDLFAQRMVARLKDVLLNEKPIASVNGARMLVRLVQEGVEEATDALVETLKDSQQNDGVKYWALKGIGEQFKRWADVEAAAAASGAPPVIPKDRKEKQLRYAQALVEAINRPMPPIVRFIADPYTDPELNGFRRLRREAVQALGLVRSPGLTDDKGALQVRVAQVLLRVVNREGLNPPPRLEEQIDAALGLARLPSKALETYQPDYTAYHLGYLVVEFASKSHQRASFKFPWKYNAARLNDALDAMRADALKDLKDEKARTYIADVVKNSLDVLTQMELREEGQPSGLNDWLGRNPPPSSTLYRGVADSTVKPMAKEEPAETPAKPPAGKPGEAKKP